MNRVAAIALDEDKAEVEALLNTLGISDIIFVRLKRRLSDSNYYLSLGKLKELKQLISESGVSKVYVYDELKPRQIINLMKELKIGVVDKIGLILEIFALHAGSKEAKLQIEMMKLMHELPLIKEWIRRAKLGELPGFLGPGAYATDAYYYSMKRRYSRIKKELARLRERRKLERIKRSSYGYPQVAIAGYTNAGKTTLFNVLANECKPVSNSMFTTISPKVKGALINGVKVVFVDTVGFIRKVPAEVIEAFYATLEEIAESDLTILMLDCSEELETILSKLKSSLDTLTKIGYVGKPLLVALNKMDLTLSDLNMKLEVVRNYLSSNYMWGFEVIPISALKGLNLDLLKESLIKTLNGVRIESIRT